MVVEGQIRSGLRGALPAAAGYARASMLGGVQVVQLRFVRRAIHSYRSAAAALAALVLAACGSSGPTPAETAALARTPVPAGQARVTITRASTLLYAGAPATITLNGKKVADIASGGSAIFDVPAGPNVLAASAWSYPGEFSVKLNATAGQTYALNVAPRSASFGPSALLGPVGGAIDASVNENAGAFELGLARGAG